MKAYRIILLAFFAGVLAASAQLPARRSMGKKDKTENTAPARDPMSSPVTARTRVTDDGEATPPAEQVSRSGMPTRNARTQSQPARPQARQNTAATPANRPQARRNTGVVNKPAAGGSIREFPTAANVPDDAAWRRDVYRSIDLTKEENAALYYPVTPSGGRQNLFVYLFRQILRGNIKAYEYTLDANEHFDEAHQLKGKKIMDTYNIYYESSDGKIRVNDADLPSEEVKLYFIKESVVYDQHTASFRTKVTALCPVMVSGTNEFGESDMQRIPLFWVNYEEAAPYLAKLSLMGSSINNASVISADDYFTMNRYTGDIYKTTNLQDRIIAQYAEDDAAQAKERERIEKELSRFEDHVWGHRRDSVKNVFGQAVTDSAGLLITRDADGRLVDAQGRRIAFAVADSVAVASPENLKKDNRMVTVLVNDRGFAVNEKGEPLLDREGKPIEITYEYPNPEGVDAPNVKEGEKAKSAKTTTSRRTTTTGNSRRTTTTKSSTAKKTPAAKTSKPKSAKPAKTKTTSAKSGTITVRRERH